MEQLKYRSVFDIIGPIMVGPSSSHTAGAARIGKIVRSIFGEQPDSVDILLYESFAKTYRGHGTDIALVGGLLGMEPDDARLADSLKIAYEKGIEVLFVPKKEKAEHPNMVKMILTKGSLKISLTLGTPTYVIVHQDVPGMIAKVTNLLSEAQINIGTMTVTREAVGDKAIMIIEVDQRNDQLAQQIKVLPHVYSAAYFD